MTCACKLGHCASLCCQLRLSLYYCMYYHIIISIGLACVVVLQAQALPHIIDSWKQFALHVQPRSMSLDMQYMRQTV